MCLSNFNGYDEDDTQNFEGLNMLSTVYSVIFSIFNTYLGSMLIESDNIKLPMTLLVLITTMGSILYTSFIWHDMTYHTVVSLVIGIIYGLVTVIAFKYISKGIEEENLNEAKLFFSQKDQFRRMFNGLQEGIILLNDSKINFMNELSNRVFSELSGLKNFAKNKDKNNVIGTKNNTLDLKLFYLFKAQDDQSEK